MALAIVFSSSLTVFAQQRAAVVPSDDEFIVIPLPEEPQVEPPTTPVFVQDAIGKPVIFNRGFDTNIGGEMRIDPTVRLTFRSLEPVFGFPGITYAPVQIRHWGEQRFFPSSLEIFATGVLLIDRGDRAEGGRFEWTINNFDRMSFHNIVRRDGFNVAWIRNWIDPQRGDKVWFFLMSDDERFTSNPITFTWP